MATLQEIWNQLEQVKSQPDYEPGDDQAYIDALNNATDVWLNQSPSHNDVSSFAEGFCLGWNWNRDDQ
jgi:hypothetical protein